MKRPFIPLYLLVIAVVSLIIYSNSFNTPFQFDDVKRILDIKAASVLDLKEIFKYCQTRFLIYLSFALNFLFGAREVFGYHLINLIIHILSSILVFLLALCIFDSPKLSSRDHYRKNKYILSFFSALIFCTHPIQTESVTYIWQRAESMAAMFSFLGLTSYAYFRLRKPKIYLYILTLLSIILGSLTKATIVSSPLMILLFEVTFVSKDMRDFKKGLKYIIPIFISLVFLGLFVKFGNLSNENIGIRLTPYYMPYYYTKLRVLVTALRLLIFPINQNLEYDFSLSSSLLNPISTLASLIFLVALFIVAVLSYKRQNLIWFSIIWFYLTLAPMSLLFLDDLFFEHYLYPTLFGYALLVPVLSLDLGRRLKFKSPLWIGMLTLLVIIYSGATYNRNKVWKTEIALWEDAFKKSPNKARVNYTLGVYYFKVSRLEEALEKYKRSLELKPDYPEAYYRLGEYYFSLGDIERSIQYYLKAIEQNPEFYEAYLNLGSAYLHKKDYRNARACFNKALTLTDSLEYRRKIEEVLGRIR